MMRSNRQARVPLVASGEELGSRVNFGFKTIGNQTITVIDRANTARRVTTNPVSVTTPPDPTPIQAAPEPPAVPVPTSITPPPAIPYGWGAPMAMSQYMSSVMALRHFWCTTRNFQV